jgi:hypothetical protein
MITELDQIRDTTNIDIRLIYDTVGKFEALFGKPIDPANIIDAVTTLMGIVSKLKDVSGKNKKFIVTHMLLFLVKETGEGVVDELLDSVLINIIPVVIDKLIAVENNKLVFNKKSFSSCFGI